MQNSYPLPQWKYRPVIRPGIRVFCGCHSEEVGSSFALYADRAQRINVAKLGGFPYISKPIRKTLAANQIAPMADPTPIAIDSQTCHHGGGAFEAIRSSMAKVFTGGRKLSPMLDTEFGLREIGSQRIHGIIKINISGIINPWASLISFTAAPTAIINEPKTRYMMMKKITT